MNDKLLAPVHSIRPAGRLLAVAALGSLLFGLAGCTVPDVTAPDPAQSVADGTSDATGTEQAANASVGGDASGTLAARDVVEQAPAATAAEALAAAQRLFDGKPTQIALDHRIDGTLEYNIELVSDTEQYQVGLGADTLAVLSEEREPIDPGGDDQQEGFDLATVVDPNEAAATARQSLPGVIHEWSLEGDSDGSVVYEFDMVPDGVPAGTEDDVEVRVNALTNELLPSH